MQVSAFMTVQQYHDMTTGTEKNQQVALIYAQGIIDGMLGLSSALALEGKVEKEFCIENAKNPAVHPADVSAFYVLLWKKQGKSMTIPALDMLLTMLTERYSCK